MEKSSCWFLLPKEIRAKIYACTDLETKEKLSLRCPEIFVLDIGDLLGHSPLVLSRKKHLYCMVQSAKNHNKAVFQNLLSNTLYADYADVFDTASYFFPDNSPQLKLLEKYFKRHDAIVLEQLIPYILAVYAGSEEIISHYLIKSMIYPEDKEGMSPLNIAVYQNHPTAVAELLLAQNIDLLNAPSSDGWHPLAGAAYMQNKKMVKFLLAFADIRTDILVDDNCAALHIAASDNHVAIAQLLLDKGCDINILGDKNKTPLWYAAENGHSDMVALLLGYKADTEMAGQIDSANMDGISDSFTPLSVAILNDHMDVVDMLVRYGVNVNVKSERDHCTPLILASEENNYDMVSLLLKNNAQVDVTDYFGYTPFIIAAENGYLFLMRLLLKNGADINHETGTNETALSVALSNEHVLTVNFLLEQPELLLTEKEHRRVDAFIASQKQKNG